MALGLDVGTSFIIAARDKDEEVEYKEFRDAFYRIKPTTPIASKMIEKGLAGRKFFKDEDQAFVVIGQDAIEKAIERHDSASRPMVAGVLAPGEKEARRILKFIISEVVSAPSSPGEKIAYSIPAQPVDVATESYDVGFHEDVIRQDLLALGFSPIPVNEAEAICFSELEEDNYTGIALSFGAGMVNICIMSNGEALIKFSTTKSGDWIDRMVSIATKEPDSVVQQQKEDGGFVVGQVNPNPILSACSTYYERLINYTVQHLNAALRGSNELMKFKDPLPIVVAGGTSRAAGFIDKFRETINAGGLPIAIKEVRPAKDQLRAVARGCMIAASL
jgi:hypothetical protein